MQLSYLFLFKNGFLQTIALFLIWYCLLQRRLKTSDW